MRKVTAEEVEKLYEFTRKHYVEYYDLQTELVDHLANGMEARWKENPKMDFEENLRLEFKKFGVFGFSDVIEKRTRSLNKKYYKLIWRETLLVLKQPRTLFFLGLSLILFKFIASINHGFYYLCGVTLILFFYYFIVFIKHQNNRPKKKQRFLIEEIIRSAGGAFNLFLIPYYATNILFSPHLGNIENTYGQWFMAFLISAAFLLAYVCWHILPKKKNQILKEVYPGMQIDS